MEKPSNTPSQRTQLIASVLLLSVPLLMVGGLLLRDHVAKQRQREFAAQMMAMQVAEGQRRQQAIIQALEAAASVEQPDTEPMTLQAVTVTPDAGYSPPPPPPR
jgi:hypothetical protein